jgi:hypothetical protein
MYVCDNTFLEASRFDFDSVVANLHRFKRKDAFIRRLRRSLGVGPHVDQFHCRVGNNVTLGIFDSSTNRRGTLLRSRRQDEQSDEKSGA